MRGIALVTSIAAVLVACSSAAGAEARGHQAGRRNREKGDQEQGDFATATLRKITSGIKSESLASKFQRTWALRVVGSRISPPSEPRKMTFCHAAACLAG
jgi:hypothetical protein